MIEWDAIDTVLLDMDGTLLDLHFDNYFWMDHLPRLYAAKHRISEEESSAFLQATFHSGEGTLQWYCLDHWSEQLEMDIPALKQEIQHMIAVRPFAIEFLTQLHASDRDVVMVTNAQNGEHRYYRLVRSRCGIARPQRAQGGSGLLAQTAGTTSLRSGPNPVD